MAQSHLSYILTKNNKDVVLSLIRCLAGYGQNCPHPPNQLERHQIGSYICQEQVAVLPWPQLLFQIQSPHRDPLTRGIDQHL